MTKNANDSLAGWSIAKNIQEVETQAPFTNID